MNSTTSVQPSPSLDALTILCAIVSGADTPQRLRDLYPRQRASLHNRLYSLRRRGLLEPWSGGRDFRLAVSAEGRRVVAGVMVGLRALKKREKGEEIP